MILQTRVLPPKNQVFDLSWQPWDETPRIGDPVVFRQIRTGQKIGGVVVDVNRAAQSYAVQVTTDVYV